LGPSLQDPGRVALGPRQEPESTPPVDFGADSRTCDSETRLLGPSLQDPGRVALGFRHFSLNRVGDFGSRGATTRCSPSLHDPGRVALGPTQDDRGDLT